MNEIQSTQTLHDKKVEQLKGLQRSLNMVEGSKRSLMAARSTAARYLSSDDRRYLEELNSIYDNMKSWQDRVKRRYF